MSEVDGLPLGWVRIKLGEAAEVLSGYGFPKCMQGKRAGDLPFYKVADISAAWQAKQVYLTEGQHYLSEEEAVQIGRPLAADTTVFAKIGAAISLNRRAMLSRPSLVDNNVMGLYPPPGLIEPKYLFYFACTLRLGNMARATTVPFLRKSDLSDIAFLLPPIAEQRRIVEKIEELFSKLDAGVAALERVQANLKRYRAAVLNTAVEGRLTEQWRAEHPDVEPACELLERILVERRRAWEEEQLVKYAEKGKTPPKNWRSRYKEPEPPDTANLPELPEGWCWARLSQAAVFQNGRAFPSSEYSEAGVKLLRPGNLLADGTLAWTDANTRRMPDSWGEEHRRYIVEDQELVMNLTAQSLKDEFLGRVCVTGPDEYCLLNQRLARITPLVGLDKRYALWMLKSSVFRRFVNGLNTGSLIQHMFTSQLNDFCFPLPPLSEQEAIAAEVESRLSVMDSVEDTLRASGTRAARLRQAILKRAFEGKLVPQDPDDEPASVLLERIAREREAAKPTKRQKQRSSGRRSTGREDQVERDVAAD